MFINPKCFFPRIMQKRSGHGKVRLVPTVSSYHSELQKRVAIIGVSLVIILVLVGLGLYVSPGKFVGKEHLNFSIEDFE